MAEAPTFSPEDVDEWVSRVGVRKSEERFFRAQFRARPDVMRELIQAGPVAVRLFLTLAPRRQFEIGPASGILGQVRGWCREIGIGKAGWRWLLRQPEKNSLELLRNTPTSRLPRFLGVLTRAGESPKDTLLWRQILMTRELFDGRVDTQASTGMLRALYREFEARETKEGRRELRAMEFPLVADWLVMVRPELDKNQCSVPWSGWMRKQEAWHQELERERRMREAERRRKVLGDREQSGFRFTELNGVSELHEEGETLNHCLKRGYGVEAAKAGRSVFFSVEPVNPPKGYNRDHPMRATLELAWWDDEWQVRQCFKFDNHKPGQKLLDAVERLREELPPPGKMMALDDEVMPEALAPLH